MTYEGAENAGCLSISASILGREGCTHKVIVCSINHTPHTSHKDGKLVDKQITAVSGSKEPSPTVTHHISNVPQLCRRMSTICIRRGIPGRIAAGATRLLAFRVFTAMWKWHRMRCVSTSPWDLTLKVLIRLQIFAGPTSESLPTSAASFQHRRRPRTDSVTSWSFYQREDEQERMIGSGDDEALEESDFDIEEESYNRRDSLSIRRDSQSIRRHSLSLRRKSSAQDARVSDPLIRHRDREPGSNRQPHRTSQTIYIASEDLTIAVTGFATSKIGYTIYLATSWLTLGVAWLVFRWFPRAHVRLIGKTSPLGDCDWVVIEVSHLRGGAYQALQISNHNASCRTNGTNSRRTMSNDANTDRHCQPSSDKAKKSPSASMHRTTTTTMTQLYSNCST